VDSLAFGLERGAIGEKHRTEVTEVTEGELRMDGEWLFGGQHGFWAGKGGNRGKASHGGHRGGTEVDGERLFGDAYRTEYVLGRLSFE
jgi:hypothetical protein